MKCPTLFSPESEEEEDSEEESGKDWDELEEEAKRGDCCKFGSLYSGTSDKGHSEIKTTSDKGTTEMSQCVLYSEVPLYTIHDEAHTIALITTY